MVEKKSAAAVTRAANTPDHVDAADGGVETQIPDPIVEPDAAPQPADNSVDESAPPKATHGSIPYYVDGVRVSRVEYVAHQNVGNKQAALDLLETALAEDSPPTPTADPATTKE